ncbi:MAG: AAA family ATPase [Thermoguttaceae bacterium]|nr:AAA family ATPase [Thermoguttaceae bacterium]MDW8078410.1 AAA family ATPase [Thermoguttaceae bacterium]
MSEQLPANREPAMSGTLAPYRSRELMEWEGSYGGMWGPAPVGPSPIKAYWHAFRRYWAAVIVVGLACGAVAGLATYHLLPQKFTASALLRIAANPEAILFDNAFQTASYEIYRSTQQQYLLSRFVLLAALRQPQVAELDSVRREPDPVAWVQQGLRVRFPGNSELMEISFTASKAHEAATIVNAVVDAYLQEVVSVELAERRQRLDDLDQLYSEKEAELRKRRNDLMQLAEQLQTSDAEALNLRERSALQRFSMFRQELANIQMSILRAQAELKIREAWINEALKIPVSDQDLEVFARNDPTYLRLQGQIETIQSRLSELARTARPEIAQQFAARYQQELKTANELLQKRRGELLEELRRRRKQALEDELAEHKFRMSVLLQQQQEIEKEVEAARQEAEKFGGRSLDVEMMRAETRILEDLLRRIGDERQKLAIELRSRPRITLVQRATTPTLPDQERRVQLSVLASIMGMALPVAGILWLDVRRRRVSSSEELSQNLGVEVLARIPHIPARMLTNGRLESPKYRVWRGILAESANSLVARLVRENETQSLRVVCVTSAESAEGKTTVACQLALGLARLGHSTLLVDFDLRRPAVDRVLTVASGPGLSEVLSGRAALEEAIQQSEEPSLYVLPGGTWDENVIPRLFNGVGQEFFARLRSGYEYVIIDCPPILPVADGRFVSLFADGVVMVARRDVSRLNRVIDALEILRSLRVRVLGAVFLGSTEDRYYYHHYRRYYGPPAPVDVTTEEPK